MYEFKLPDLGEGIHEAEIVRWHVEPGGTIGRDEPLVDVETDKAAVTIPCPVGGKVVELAGKVGDTIRVGQVLAIIDQGQAAATAEPAKPAEAPTEPAKPAEAPHRAPAPPRTQAQPPGPVHPPPARRVAPAAPATRRLARELGVDIRLLSGSGPAGRVTPEDVQAAAGAGAGIAGQPAEPEAAGPEPAGAGIPLLQIEPLPDFSRFGPVELEPLRSIRRKTARRMTNAWIQIPHVAHFDEADVTALEAFRQRNRPRLAERAGVNLTLLAFVIKAATHTLRRMPQFNASLDALGEQIVYKRYYNIGVAVATERGLVVPVVRETDRKSVAEIAAAVSDLAERGRQGTLGPEDFQGASFTVTNMGPAGGTAATPIINHPEVAILAMMRAVDKPVVRDGRIVVRRMMPLVLSFDHRLIDGVDAAAFVNEIVRLLGDPDALLLES